MITARLTDRRGDVAAVLRDSNVAPYYPPATVGAAWVKVWAREKGKGIDTALVLAEGKPGSELSVLYNPDIDTTLLVTPVSYSSSGVPSVSDLEHAEWQEFVIQRETEAPVIGQNSPATTEAVEIGITGHTRFARYRRVKVWADADMTDLLRTITLDSADYAARELPRYLTLSRSASGQLATEAGIGIETEEGDALVVEEEGGALPLTVYVTVAHSSGVAWTPESNVLEITFADGSGSGGSVGDFDPTPRDFRTIDEV